MKNLWLPDEVEYLKNNWSNITLNDAILALPRHTRSSISDKVFREGLSEDKWTVEQLSLLNEYYGNIHIDKLSEKINKSKQAVYTKAFRLGLESSQYVNIFAKTLNDNFFSVPNPINCYWAGFIAADGCIGQNLTTFSISQNELQVLENFKRDIEFSGNIKKCNRPHLKNNHYVLTANSKTVVKDLKENFNIVPRKSLILMPPEKLSYYHSLCYIIGLCDGDGSICFTTNKNKPNQSPILCFIISGTKDICLWVQKVFDCGGNVKKHSKCNIYYYTIVCRKARNIIYKLRDIEEVAHLRLQRKWDKILQWEQSHKISS
jgi:hypothetical protein